MSILTHEHQVVNNSEKSLVIYQPRFLGDIIFICSLAQYFSKIFREVLIPVDPDLISKVKINQYIPFIKFIPLSEYVFPAQSILPGFYYFNDHVLLNLSNTSIYKNHMGKKYKLASLPIEQWRELTVIRNPLKELELSEFLKITNGEKYNLINSMYSNKESNTFFPEINNSYRNILLQKIEGFNLFDWMGVIENAHTIHTVHTSLQYLIDLIPKTTNELHIYPRYEIHEPHSYYDYLFVKNYNYHPYPSNIKYRLIFNLKSFKNFIFRFYRICSLTISTYFLLNFIKEKQWMKH